MSWVKASASRTDARSKHWSWYWASYGDKLTAEGMALLVECGVPENEIEEHVLRVVSLLHSHTPCNSFPLPKLWRTRNPYSDLIVRSPL